MDYGQDLQFGIFPTPNAAAVSDAASILQLAEVAEVSGIDLVTVQDHPYQARHLDALTLTSVLAARGSAIRVALNVANLPLRQPVVLAKSIATLDLLTGGRVELGLGAGAFWDAIVAAGGPRRTPGQSVAALEEAIEVIRAVWQPAGSASVRVEGEHYRVVGLHPGPAPAHPVEIWLGSYGPRMLRLTGRVADGWLPSMGYAGPAKLGELSRIIDDAARAAGRDPAAVRRLYNIGGRFTGQRMRGGEADRLVTGSPQDWAEQLAGLTLEHGISTFIVGTDDPDDVRRFGLEVAPLVRDLVDAGRAAVASQSAGTATAAGLRGAAPGSAGSAGSTPYPAGSSARDDDAVPLQVHPTSDDGTRLSDQAAWDESTRPMFPAPADVRYTLEQQAAPQHLIVIHNALRGELSRLREIVQQVADGLAAVGDARSAINRMSLRQNAWTLGAYCGQYCRIVTGHHTLEDVSMFPHLRRVAGAAPVVDRLEEEHEVIAGLLDAMDRALVGVVDVAGSPEGGGAQGEAPGAEADALDRLIEVLDLFTDALLSHLAYEERELLHPLALTGLA